MRSLCYCGHLTFYQMYDFPPVPGVLLFVSVVFPVVQNLLRLIYFGLSAFYLLPALLGLNPKYQCTKQYQEGYLFPVFSPRFMAAALRVKSSF